MSSKDSLQDRIVAQKFDHVTMAGLVRPDVDST
jgi:hypothetical protein